MEPPYTKAVYLTASYVRQGLHIFLVWLVDQEPLAGK